MLIYFSFFFLKLPSGVCCGSSIHVANTGTLFPGGGERLGVSQHPNDISSRRCILGAESAVLIASGTEMSHFS